AYESDSHPGAIASGSSCVATLICPSGTAGGSSGLICGATSVTAVSLGAGESIKRANGLRRVHHMIAFSREMSLGTLRVSPFSIRRPIPKTPRIILILNGPSGNCINFGPLLPLLKLHECLRSQLAGLPPGLRWTACVDERLFFRRLTVLEGIATQA